MGEEFEEMERIPWAALAASAPDPRRRLAVAGAGVAAVVVLLVIVGGSLLRSSPPAASGTLPLVSSTTSTTGDEPVSSVPPSEVAGSKSETAMSRSVYAEADLMAASVDEEVRIAAMWAERFVRDYLTVDGAGSNAPDAPQLAAAEVPAALDGVTSFVEWVDAYAVTAIRPARYRVEVAYRLLTGSDGNYARQAAAALAVSVDVDVDGSASITGYPEVVETPALRTDDGPALTSQLPDWVLESVPDDGSSVVLGGYRQSDRWWVVVVSELAPGVARPHVVGVSG